MEFDERWAGKYVVADGNGSESRFWSGKVVDRRALDGQVNLVLMNRIGEW